MREKQGGSVALERAFAPNPRWAGQPEKLSKALKTKEKRSEEHRRNKKPAGSRRYKMKTPRPQSGRTFLRGLFY